MSKLAKGNTGRAGSSVQKLEDCLSSASGKVCMHTGMLKASPMARQKADHGLSDFEGLFAQRSRGELDG
jgi:hypothetical protein